MNDTIIILCAFSDCRMPGAIWPPAQQSSATALFPWGEREEGWRNGNDAIADDCCCWEKVMQFLFIQKRPETFRKLSPCSENKMVDFLLIHMTKSILTEDRVLKMVNEGPKTIASFDRNRLRARLLSVGLCERGTRNFCWYTWPKTYSNRSPCSENGQWSPQNDSQLRSQSATSGYSPWGYMKVRTTVITKKSTSVWKSWHVWFSWTCSTYFATTCCICDTIFEVIQQKHTHMLSLPQTIKAILADRKQEKSCSMGKSCTVGICVALWV
jgi:hypothetical protein